MVVIVLVTAIVLMKVVVNVDGAYSDGNDGDDDDGVVLPPLVVIL